MVFGEDKLYIFTLSNFIIGDNENRTRVRTFSLWLSTLVEPFYPLNYMVRRVGFEPTMFTLRDWFYRPMQHHHRCRRRLVENAEIESATSALQEQRSPS